MPDWIPWYATYSNLVIDSLRDHKESMSDKVDELRYTFIDELKEFYEMEIEKLNQLNPKPIEPLVSTEEDQEAIFQSWEIIKEEEKEEEDKVTMSLNVGNISIDSEEYKELLRKNSNSREETKEDEQGKAGSDFVKFTPRKVIDFHSTNVDDISSQNLNDSLLEVTVEKPRKRGISYEENLNTYKITNIHKQRSKIFVNYIFRRNNWSSNPWSWRWWGREI